MTKKISSWAMFVRAFVIALFAGTSVSHAQETNLTDDAAWAQAISVGTSDAIRDYLRHFPTGTHLDAAVRLLLSLGSLQGTGAGFLPGLNSVPGQNLY